jgi:basic amino acid/polyamine antiporter, APA family
VTGGASNEAPRQVLPRVLGPLDGLAMVVGMVIGVGILRTPGLIAQHLPDGRWILGMWVAGGVMAALSTLVFAELAAAIPQAGGKYTYARKAYGDAIGFAVGALDLFGIRAFTSASKAVVIGGFLVELAGRGSAQLLSAAIVIVLLTLHLQGLRTGAWVQNLVTALKVLVLIAIVVVGFALGTGASWEPIATPSVTTVSFLSFALAYQSIWFTYYGWEDVVKMAEDIRDPGRNVPRAMLGGAAVIALLYLAVNVAYLHALTPGEMAGSQFVARDAIGAALGSAAGTALSVAGLIIVIAGLNANFMSMPRIPFALARDGFFPTALARLDARGTPVRAIVFAASLMLVLAVTGSFELLVRFMTFIMLVVDGTIIVSLFVLRRRFPDVVRPFRVPWYPWIPIVVAAMYLGVISLLVVTQPALALGGMGLVTAAVIAGLVMVRVKPPRTEVVLSA